MPEPRELIFVKLNDVVLLELELGIGGLETFNLLTELFDQDIDHVCIVDHSLRLWLLSDLIQRLLL